jgi:N-ethylmaleimide reductase
VGIRLSPLNAHYDMLDSDPAATFGYAVAALDRLGLLYLHLREMPAEGDRLGARHFRPLWRGAVIVNGGYDRVRADAALAAGSADLAAFGQLFVANPDLPRRFRAGAPLNRVDPATLADGGAEGYVDYPSLDTKS